MTGHGQGVSPSADIRGYGDREEAMAVVRQDRWLVRERARTTVHCTKGLSRCLSKARFRAPLASSYCLHACAGAGRKRGLGAETTRGILSGGRDGRDGGGSLGAPRRGLRCGPGGTSRAEAQRARCEGRRSSLLRGLGANQGPDGRRPGWEVRGKKRPRRPRSGRRDRASASCLMRRGAERRRPAGCEAERKRNLQARIQKRMRTAKERACGGWRYALYASSCVPASRRTVHTQRGSSLSLPDPSGCVRGCSCTQLWTLGICAA